MLDKCMYRLNQDGTLVVPNSCPDVVDELYDIKSKLEAVPYCTRKKRLDQVIRETEKELFANEGKSFKSWIHANAVRLFDALYEEQFCEHNDQIEPLIRQFMDNVVLKNCQKQ